MDAAPSRKQKNWCALCHLSQACQGPKHKMVFSQLGMPVRCCASAPAAAAVPPHSTVRGHKDTEGYDTAQHGIFEAWHKSGYQDLVPEIPSAVFPNGKQQPWACPALAVFYVFLRNAMLASYASYGSCYAYNNRIGAIGWYTCSNCLFFDCFLLSLVGQTQVAAFRPKRS